MQTGRLVATPAVHPGFTEKKQMPIEWKHGEALALSQQRCTACLGLGMRAGRNERRQPCHCVERAVFRACHDRFHRCAVREGHIGRVSLEANPSRRRKSMYSLKNEEYMADFLLVSRRVLNEQRFKLFRYYFLLGADWKICTQKLGINRGEFFHEVYRVQEVLGKTFYELRPHPLYPLDEYFGGGSRK